MNLTFSHIVLDQSKWIIPFILVLIFGLFIIPFVVIVPYIVAFYIFRPQLNSLGKLILELLSHPEIDYGSDVTLGRFNGKLSGLNISNIKLLSEKGEVQTIPLKLLKNTKLVLTKQPCVKDRKFSFKCKINMEGSKNDHIHHLHNSLVAYNGLSKGSSFMIKESDGLFTIIMNVKLYYNNVELVNYLKKKGILVLELRTIY